VDLQSLSCARHPVCSIDAHVMGIATMPSDEMFEICGERGPHVPPASSWNVARYVAPGVAHGFAFCVVIELAVPVLDDEHAHSARTAIASVTCRMGPPPHRQANASLGSALGLSLIGCLGLRCSGKRRPKSGARSRRACATW
jgi:hypothetical protein